MALLACGTTEPTPEGSSPVGVRLEVHLLDQHFVRFEGKRMPWEAFALDVRAQCRAATGDSAQRPWIRMLAPVDGSVTAATVEQLRKVLTDSGVKYITSGFEDS